MSADLITEHAWVVEKVVRSAGHREHADDMRQEGFIALMRAAESFKANRGVKFSSYAFKWVDGAVRRYLTRQVRRHEIGRIDAEEQHRE